MTPLAAPSDRKKVASWTPAIHGASSVALELTYSKHGNLVTINDIQVYSMYVLGYSFNMLSCWYHHVSSMVLAYLKYQFTNTKHDTAAQQRAISGAKTGISELPVNSQLPWHSKWMARLRIKKCIICINNLWVAEIGVLRNEIEFDKFVPSIGAILLLMNNTSMVPNT